jgi:CRISPR-associated protein Csb2
MLALEVTFLTGRYVATAYDDRDSAEWPPHPARLFSALVAAHFETNPTAESQATLEWFESLGAPEIHASDAWSRDVVTNFVPVNDSTVTGSFAKEEAALDAAHQALALIPQGEKARKAAERDLERAEKRLQEKTERAIQGASFNASAVKTGISVLPERRVRQPRTFPSVTPQDPRVFFIWPGVDPTEKQIEQLDAIASNVVRIGHSSSLASVRVVQEAPAPTWLPSQDGHAEAESSHTLRVFDSGQFDLLCQSFENQGDSPGRVLPARFQRYVRPRSHAADEPARGLFGDDWIVLRRVDGPRLPSTRAADVGRSLRAALLSSYGPDAPEILSGHRAPDEPSTGAHLAYVALPFVGHRHADGSILGVALVLPKDASPEDRHAVYRALSNWENSQRVNGPGLEPAKLPLLLGRAGVLGLERVEGYRRLETLHPQTWTAGSRVWMSATPVALDRNPGNLRSKDPEEEAAAYANAGAIVAKACSDIGLPAPESIQILPAAPLPGAAKARQFPPFRSGKSPIQRVLVHVTIRFSQRVMGPVLLGSGRYFGLGLFRPVSENG